MKKIMFNDLYCLTAAVIKLRKTNTRKPCKDKATNKLILAEDVHSWRYYPEENIVEFVMNDGSVKVSVPPYKVGEVVAVAQSYKDLDYGFYGFATNPSRSCGIKMEYAEKQKGWGNKMFVESKFMPHQIRITNIKVERLQDISDEDCLKEGVFLDVTAPKCYQPFYTFVKSRTKDGCPIGYDSPQYAFSHLIHEVSGKGTWESNPFVFAYTFELVK